MWSLDAEDQQALLCVIALLRLRGRNHCSYWAVVQEDVAETKRAGWGLWLHTGEGVLLEEGLGTGATALRAFRP